MLRRSARKRFRKERQQQTLENLHSWGQKGDGAISSTQIRGFARFGDGDFIGLLPYSGEVSMGKGKVIKLSKVCYSMGAKILKVEGG
jgi:hypothetical protein